MELPDYWLARPDDASPAVRAAFDDAWQRALARGDAPLVAETLPGPKWQFLCHLCDAHGLVLHGSGRPDITTFEPRQAHDLQEFGRQRAVYAAGDGIWAMFFAIVQRERMGAVTNACVRLADAAGQVGPPRYFFSVSRTVAPRHRWRSGTVYVLPADTFVLQPTLRFGAYEVLVPQLASPVPVRPLARLAVDPADFPFLAQVRTHDDDRLAEYARALETGAPWPE